MSHQKGRWSTGNIRQHLKVSLKYLRRPALHPLSTFRTSSASPTQLNFPPKTIVKILGSMKRSRGRRVGELWCIRVGRARRDILCSRIHGKSTNMYLTADIWQRTRYWHSNKTSSLYDPRHLLLSAQNRHSRHSVSLSLYNRAGGLFYRLCPQTVRALERC